MTQYSPKISSSADKDFYAAGLTCWVLGTLRWTAQRLCWEI